MTDRAGPRVALLVHPPLLADVVARQLRAAGCEVLIDDLESPVDLVLVSPSRARERPRGDAPVVVLADDRPPGPTLAGASGTLVQDLDDLLAMAARLHSGL